MRLKPGQQAPSFDVEDVFGKRHRLEDFRGSKLLLSFYRYAGCPLCNLRIHELSERRDFFAETGLKVLAFFESPRGSVMSRFEERDVPFPIVADPGREVYRSYGVESSWGGFARAMIHPTSIRALANGFLPGRMEGDVALLPADFLIAPDARIQQVHYAQNITEHMPLSWVEAFATAQ